MTYFSEIKINTIKDKIVNFAGLQPLIELFYLFKLREIIEENIHASGTKGFTDAEIIQALVTMQIAVGAPVRCM